MKLVLFLIVSSFEIEFRLEFGHYGRLLGLIDLDKSSNEKIWSTVCHTKYTGKKIKSNSMLKMIADDTCNTIDSSMNPITKSRVKLITTADASTLPPKLSRISQGEVLFPQSIGKFKCRNEKSSKVSTPLNAYLSSCQRKPSDCGTVSRRTGDIMIECNPPNVINTSSSWSEWTSWTDKCNSDYGAISERWRNCSVGNVPVPVYHCKFNSDDKWIETRKPICPQYNDYDESDVDYGDSSYSLSFDDYSEAPTQVINLDIEEKSPEVTFGTITRKKKNITFEVEFTDDEDLTEASGESIGLDSENEAISHFKYNLFLFILFPFII